MKLSKRVLSLFMAMVMCFGMVSMTAMAAEEVPADKMVVAISDDDAGIMPLSNDYASCWVPAGKTSGYFTIEKSFSSQGNVTFRARSDNNSVPLRMKVSKSNDPSNGFTVSTGWMSLTTDDKEAKPSTSIGNSGTFYVHYEFTNGNPNGTFLMCWIYG